MSKKKFYKTGIFKFIIAILVLFLVVDFFIHEKIFPEPTYEILSSEYYTIKLEKEKSYFKIIQELVKLKEGSYTFEKKIYVDILDDLDYNDDNLLKLYQRELKRLEFNHKQEVDSLMEILKDSYENCEEYLQLLNTYKGSNKKVTISRTEAHRMKLIKKRIGDFDMFFYEAPIIVSCGAFLAVIIGVVGIVGFFVAFIWFFIMKIKEDFFKY